MVRMGVSPYRNGVRALNRKNVVLFRIRLWPMNQSLVIVKNSKYKKHRKKYRRGKCPAVSWSPWKKGWSIKHHPEHACPCFVSRRYLEEVLRVVVEKVEAPVRRCKKCIYAVSAWTRIIRRENRHVLHLPKKKPLDSWHDDEIFMTFSLGRWHRRSKGPIPSILKKRWCVCCWVGHGNGCPMGCAFVVISMSCCWEIPRRPNHNF
mmetsp:Transcript_24366/g.27196  ORF Transcript_24366/g.27196 Transcript_24366/m.27196 type:complete len:205 (+) Transcript_24366:297-911(+)